MADNFLKVSGINLAQHEQDPPNPVEGDLYYNSVTENLRVYQDGNWASLDTTEDEGITELTGDVTAGPGSGPQVATLATVTIAKGGTGQVTAPAAFNALSPMTSDGDIIYNTGGVATRLPIGAASEVLTVSGGIPAWAPGGGGGSGITQLTGDVTAGPGSGSQVATIAAASVDHNKLAASSVDNSNIMSNAQIDYFKLAPLAAGAILVGNASNNPQVAVVTGDISLSPTGVTAYVGTVPIAKGGTGQTTSTAAFDALSPMSTQGDIIFRSTASAERLGIGTAGQVLTVVGDLPVWSANPPSANTQLSNLDATAINQDLVFGSGIAGVLKTLDATSLTTNLTLATGNSSTGLGGAINIVGGSGSVNNSGAVSITAGSAGSFVGGTVTIQTANFDAVASGSSGSILLATGSANSQGLSGAQGGGIAIIAGAGQSIGDSGGSLYFQSGGTTSGYAGTIQLQAGNATAAGGLGGNIQFQAGSSNNASGASNIYFAAGNNSTNFDSGFISLSTANATGTGNSGSIDLLTGSTESGAVGQINLTGGNASSAGGTGGGIVLTGGNSTDTQGGNIVIQGGVASGTGNSGDVTLLTSNVTGSGTRGKIRLQTTTTTFEGSTATLITESPVLAAVPVDAVTPLFSYDGTAYPSLWMDYSISRDNGALGITSGTLVVSCNGSTTGKSDTGSAAAGSNGTTLVVSFSAPTVTIFVDANKNGTSGTIKYFVRKML